MLGIHQGDPNSNFYCVPKMSAQKIKFRLGSSLASDFIKPSSAVMKIEIYFYQPFSPSFQYCYVELLAVWSVLKASEMK